MQKYSVQWYPGHIARAERQLKSQLKLVDVVLEVRDARYNTKQATSPYVVYGHSVVCCTVCLAPTHDRAHLICRIPLSSCHPQIPTWCMNKPRLLIMNRADMVSQQDQQDWSNYYGRQGLSVYYTDANAGKGITKVMLHAVECVMMIFVAKEINPVQHQSCSLPHAVL